MNCTLFSCVFLFAACAAYGSQMSQTIALKMVQASLATAMSYLSVVWGILSGYFVFSEVGHKLLSPKHMHECSSHQRFMYIEIVCIWRELMHLPQCENDHNMYTCRITSGKANCSADNMHACMLACTMQTLSNALQVPNALSLGGACLVCSCTIVLGFAEHISHANTRPQTQMHWWQKAGSWAGRMQYVFSSTMVALWRRCSGQHDMYESIAGKEVNM